MKEKKKLNKNNAKRLKKILTIVHKETLEANASRGRFNVICDKVPSPNMRNPMAPTPPYNKKGKTKLYNNKVYEVSEKNTKENKYVLLSLS